MPARKLTWKRTLSILKLYPELLAFNGFLLFKVILFSWDMNSSYATMGMVVSTAVLLLALSSWLLLLPLKSRILGFFAFDLLLSVVLLADSLYYDFFDRVIPYPVLRQTGEVGAVTSSLREVISTNDCLLFADFLFLIPFAWLLKSGRLRFRFPRLSLKTRALHAATVCTLSLSVLAMNTISLASASGRDVFTDLY
ncbi:MAG TPA: hypothetical protein VFV52_03620, partial [Bacilli bacterium]|nr:hypothetical protein [Bacilli bacterium]